MGDHAVDVLANGALLRRMVSFQSGLPWRLHQYLHAHRDLYDEKLSGRCGTLSYLALVRDDVQILTQVAALSATSAYYQHLPTLSLEDAMRAATTQGCLSSLQWLHAPTQCSGSSSYCDRHALTRAAVAGHLDLVQWLRTHCSYCCSDLEPSALIQIARSGHVSVLAYFASDHHADWVLRSDVFAAAAQSGDLATVHYLHSLVHHGNDDKTAMHLCQSTMNAAASAGHLEIVCFLHAHCHADGMVTAATMDAAATEGHLEIVAFLHHERDEGCTKYAMDRAASNGYLSVVRFLHTHRTEGCTTYAMDSAAKHNHLDVVRYLHTHRREGCSPWALTETAQSGHVAVAAFLVEHVARPDWEDSFLFRAARSGHLEMVHYLCEHTAMGDRLFDAHRAAKSYAHVEVAQYLAQQIQVLMKQREEEVRDKLRRRKHAKARKSRRG